MKTSLVVVLWCIGYVSNATDSLKILFVYGSKPISKDEDKWFGGIHGGHVSISYKKEFASFVPNGNVHVFKRKKINSRIVFEYEDRFVFDTTGSRFLIITIPIDSIQRVRLDSVIRKRYEVMTYDYAFFGMRCASSAYEMCASAGIFETIRINKLWRKYFYPKLLRKELIKKAKQNAWPMYYRSGKTTRKWESD